MIYAIDFDGTIVENKWPNIGKLNPDAVKFIRAVKDSGGVFILWTNRVGQRLQDAVDFLAANDIAPDYVNSNVPEVIEDFGSDSRKVYADVFIDDRNAGGLVWPTIKIKGQEDNE